MLLRIDIQIHSSSFIFIVLTGVTKKSGKTLQIAETKTVSAIFVISLSGRIVNIVRYGGVQFVNS